MITITIDGRQIQTEPTKTIIEAAFEHDIYIPHFCWHPALSISGNCRMCLVEVEKMPKQVIACSTMCADGMVVHVNSAKAIDARAAVMEFILINHPLDCPICDEAGECKLQDYAYRYSVGESAFDEEKQHKRKRDLLGPHVMFDAERCISCSRCIRFCEDVVHQPQLTFVNRGDRVTIETYPGKKLDNPYAMNVIDLCPVGALTSADFRFKSRVWDMSRTESVCPGCARGCSIDVWTRQNEILRLTPRENPSVNSYWMCDNGRLNSFRDVHAPTRITKPMIRKDGDLKEVEWSEAIAHAAFELRAYKKDRIAFIGSATETCEDNFILNKLAKEIFESGNVAVMPHVKPEDQDDVLIRADKTPNARGAALAGMQSTDAAHDLNAIITNVASGKIQALVVMNDDVTHIPEFAAALPKLSFICVLASNETETSSRADVVLPAATFAEKLGTFINFAGHIQLIQPAIYTQENEHLVQPFGRSRLEKFGSQFDRWNQFEKNDVRSSWSILLQLGQTLGAKWRFNSAEQVFIEMAKTIPTLRGLTYTSIGRRGRTVADESDERRMVYEDVLPVHS